MQQQQQQQTLTLTNSVCPDLILTISSISLRLDGSSLAKKAALGPAAEPEEKPLPILDVVVVEEVVEVDGKNGSRLPLLLCGLGCCCCCCC